MATKLGLYNDALAHLGERKLVTLADDDESRHTLDLHYDRAVRYCLEQGLWNFALRAVAADASASLAPAFGYAHAFEKPADWIRTAQVSADQRFAAPLACYEEEGGGLWYADVDPLYVQYVSDDAGYGRDLAHWPETFADYVGCHLARRVCLRLTASETRLERLERLEQRLRIDARAKDALNQAVGRMPPGDWVKSRGAGARGPRSARLGG
jgi:hypothetical protein